MTRVYEDGNRPDQTFDLIPTNAESPDDNTNMFVGTDTADAIESAQSGSLFGAGGDNTVMAPPVECLQIAWVVEQCQVSLLRLLEKLTKALATFA